MHLNLTSQQSHSREREREGNRQHTFIYLGVVLSHSAAQRISLSLSLSWSEMTFRPLVAPSSLGVRSLARHLRNYQQQRERPTLPWSSSWTGCKVITRRAKSVHAICLNFGQFPPRAHLSRANYFSRNPEVAPARPVFKNERSRRAFSVSVCADEISSQIARKLSAHHIQRGWRTFSSRATLFASHSRKSTSTLKKPPADLELKLAFQIPTG